MVTMVAVIIAFLLGGLFGFITYGLCYVCGKSEEEDKHYNVLYLCNGHACDKYREDGKYVDCDNEDGGGCKYTNDILYAQNFISHVDKGSGFLYFTEIERGNKISEEDGKEHCSIIENPQDVINPDKVTNILGFSND